MAVNEIHKWSDSEKMRFHLKMEHIKNELEKNTIRITTMQMFTPVKNLYNKWYDISSDGELQIRNMVYPQLSEKPTEEQKARLVETFKETEDWNDEELNIYDELYLK